MTFASLPRSVPRVILLVAGWLAQSPLPAATSAAETRAGATAGGPQLAVIARSHDFGTVPRGQVLEHEFSIRNTGGQVLEIAEIRSSCGCTTTREWPRRLEPGASGLISIRLETAQFVGAIAKTITVLTNDPGQPWATLELKATIWAPITLSAHLLLFPAIMDPTQPATRTLTLRREVAGTLALSDLQSDNPHFQPSVREIVPGGEYELSVALVPPLPEGTQSGNITMKTGLAALPAVTVPVVATVLPAVQVAPTEIMFSTARLAASEKRFAVLVNHRAFDLKVSDVTINAPGVQLSTTAAAGGKQFTIVLTFPAGFEFPPGARFVLRGRTNHPALSAFEVPIRFPGDR